jgi:hypothetical protein
VLDELGEHRPGGVGVVFSVELAQPFLDPVGDRDFGVRVAEGEQCGESGCGFLVESFLPTSRARRAR